MQQAKSLRIRFPTVAFVLLVAGRAVPAAPPSIAAIVGEWRGTSLCTNREVAPACKDERVVYTFSPSRTAPADAVHLKADTLVNGAVVPMYELDLTFEPVSGTWRSEVRSEGFSGLWSYTVEGSRLSGTLVELPSNALLRRVEAAKAQPAGSGRGRAE
jgi:hypothetical protein